MALLPAVAPARRAAAAAVVASAVVHGAALVGFRGAGDDDDGREPASYSATLQPAVAAQPPPAAAPPPPPRPAPRPRARASRPVPLPDETLAFLPREPHAAAPAQEPDLAPLPEIVALAQPAAPEAAPGLPEFRPDALPVEVTISYALTSVFADGEAEYTWKREGDRYEITGTAQATGFFTLFLEGRIDQSATGRVTGEGLRPERFVERRGSTAEEGLDFDWDARRVQFRRGDSVREVPLADATVDWLSMIFQLAHRPPKGDSMPLRVFTQRRLYQYRLEVVGVEEIELPFGRVPALHLRHAGDAPEQAVDVWLGVEQHYLPVKLRYPVARNRLVVEQTATSVRAAR